MPTPVGHSLAAAALYLATAPGTAAGLDWRGALLCLVAASAADLDFLPGGLVGDWNRFHQGPSHSLAVALVVALALACVPLPSLGGFRRRLVLLTALTVSHLALDVITHDARPPYGIPLFWPFSDAYVHASLEVFPNVRRGPLRVVLSASNWRAVGMEMLVLAPVAAAAACYRVSRRAARSGRTAG